MAKFADQQLKDQNFAKIVFQIATNFIYIILR